MTAQVKSPTEILITDELGRPVGPHDGANGHRGQVTWMKAAYLFKTVVLATGRQASKTTFCKFLLVDEMAHFDRGFYRAAYMAQSHPRAEKMFEEMLDALDRAHVVKRSKNKGQDRWIEVLRINDNNGAMLHFWSGEAEAHEGAQGESLHRGILDEASLVPEEAFTVTMRPMFNATKGQAVVIGSPIPGGIGFDWFERTWNLGDLENPDRDERFLSFNVPSEANPFADVADIALGRASCRSHDEQLCLYDGKFAKDMGAVFSNLKACFVLQAVEESPGIWVHRRPATDENTVAGLDLGKHQDATVLSIFSRKTHEQLAVCRIQKTDYHAQLPTIDRLVREFNNPVLYADARDGGGMLIESLKRLYSDRAIPVKWTMGGTWDKATAVVRGQDLFQRAAWKLIDVKWQKEEFRLFSKKALPAGGWKYEAPSNTHDDGVTAALYAAYALPVPVLTLETKEPEIASGSREMWEYLEATQTPLGGVQAPYNLRSLRR